MAEKWSINRLHDETGMDRRTIKNILRNTDPCDYNESFPLYRLADFIEAIRKRDEPKVAGDLEAEQTRLTAAKADIAEVERARVRNEVIETSTVFNVWENIAVSIRRTILTSNLSTEEKDSVLNELRNLKVEDFLEQREFDQGVASEVSESVHAS
jgi:phage terminase Nu1 subunit (DNA packaging protein)